MRDLSEVINQLLEVIPEEQDDLRAELESHQRSAIMAAPEAMRIWWQHVACTLGESMGDELHTSGWQKQVQDIWMDRK